MISESYIEMNRELHKNPEYGTTGHRHAEQVMQIATAADATEILDYGCGKQTLNRSLPQFIVRGYDPAVAGLDRRPKPHHVVVCTDVMEHVEPEHVDAVLDDIESLTERVAYLAVCMVPAKKTLPDGRNAHISLHDADWWGEKLNARFDIAAFVENEKGRGFIAICEKKDAA